MSVISKYGHNTNTLLHWYFPIWGDISWAVASELSTRTGKDSAIMFYTQNKRRVVVALGSAVSAYGSPLLRVVLHWSHWLPYKKLVLSVVLSKIYGNSSTSGVTSTLLLTCVYFLLQPLCEADCKCLLITDNQTEIYCSSVFVSNQGHFQLAL